VNGLTIGQAIKHPSNPLFGEDKPWESRFDNVYANVIYDQQEKIYKCWSSPYPIDHSAKGMTREQRRISRRRIEKWDCVTPLVKTASNGTSGLSALDVRVAGVARLQDDPRKTELLRVRLRQPTQSFHFDKPLACGSAERYDLGLLSVDLTLSISLLRPKRDCPNSKALRRRHPDSMNYEETRMA
jgi:hypothetical protein